MADEKSWGRWELDTKEPVSLRIWATPYFPYDIVLSGIQTLDSMMGWLGHMSEKRWVSSRDLVDLFRALFDLGLIAKALEREGRSSQACLEKLQEVVGFLTGHPQ